MKNIFFYIAIVLSLFLVACKKNNYKNSTIESDKTFFGLEQGRFIEYKVQFMDHDSLLNKHDTSIFYYKTVVGDEYIDNEGRKGFEFLRYKKDSIAGTYEFISKWTTVIADNKAQLVEENQRKIKLIFPFNTSESWNVNMLNTTNEQLAHYEEIYQSKNYFNLYFDSTVTVEFHRFQSLIDDQLEQEVYAKGIGMIYKVSKNLYYQFGYSNPFKGTELYYTVINYGK